MYATSQEELCGFIRDLAISNTFAPRQQVHVAFKDLQHPDDEDNWTEYVRATNSRPATQEEVEATLWAGWDQGNGWEAPGWLGQSDEIYSRAVSYRMAA